MINRVLIRIKVVQMLYSYLLTEKMFSIESQPVPPTKEKRFAYALYLDLLSLFADIAQTLKIRGRGLPIADNRFIQAILADEKVKSIRNRSFASIGASPITPAILESLTEKIKESAILKSYLKADSAQDQVARDARLWQDIFTQIILPDQALAQLIEQRPDYSPRGVERMKTLMADTFSNFATSQDYDADAIKTLRHSLSKAHELYHWLLLLPIEITNLQEQRLDDARHKYILTDEDINPNLRFVENQFVAALADNAQLRDYIETHKISWLPNDRQTITLLLKAIMASDYYKNYMAAPSTDFSNDCELWRNLYRHVIFQNPDFQEALEDKSVFWNDDLDIIGTFVIKTIRRIEQQLPSPLLDMYKDEEDSQFAYQLFRSVLSHKTQYREMINQVVNTDSWDIERLAFMDVVILLTAIAELLNFPKIPATVTINEYIEIAKSYSTSKSGHFVNGILATILRQLRQQNLLNKE